MKFYYLDFSALLVMLILLSVLFFKRMIRGDINRYFLLLLCVSIATTVADVWAIMLDNGVIEGGETAKYIAHSLYLFLHNATTPLFIVYCTALTDTWVVGKYRMIKKILFWLPLVTIYVLLLFNGNSQKMFYLDANGAYTRGPWFGMLYLITGIYVVYGIGKVIRCWIYFDIGRWVALFSGIGFMLIATVIQFFHKELRIEMFSGALALLFILLMVHRPEEMIDNETGLLTQTAFKNLMFRSEKRNKLKKIIVFSVTNYKKTHAKYRYEQEIVLGRGIADIMTGYTEMFKERADVYHIGSGRFAMVAKAEEPSINVVNVARQLNETLSKPFELDNTEVYFEPNICVIQFLKDIQDANTLMHFIEDLGGTGKTDDVIFARDTFKQERYDILTEIDDILEDAIKNKKFKVYYQPIYSVEEGCFRTAEALIRLYDDKYGFIPPDLFIPAAERSGAILEIGDIVLEQVCEFISSEVYKKLGLHYIEVNLSVVQCMHEGMVGNIMELFDKYHIRSTDINLEITETAVSDGQEIMDRNINDLFNEGICFSLDDFGTGYSNMQRIASLPLSIIKIDKTIVDDAGKLSMQIVIENTVKMIKALGMKIVVEGVETEQQLNQFISLRCDYIQGYYFSKPLPKDDFVTFLMDKAS